MPNRYEREIEEILRNLEQTEPKQGLGQKFSQRIRRRPPARVRARPRGRVSVTLTIPEWLLLISIVLALIAAGYEYLMGEPDIFSGILATIGAICLLLVVLAQFIFQPHRQTPQYGNVVNIRPIRQGPLNSIKTRWNLFLLKMRYRRQNDRR